MKHVEIRKSVSGATRRKKKTIMTRTVYEARWSSFNSTAVVVLGYLGESTWKVHCLVTRRETTARTGQLRELDPMDMRNASRPAQAIRVNDEELARGVICQLSADVESATLYEGPGDRAKHVLDKGRPGYVASVFLKKGTQVSVIRDAKWRREILLDGPFGPKVRVRLADGRYAAVPRCLLAPVTAPEPANGKAPSLKLVV